MDAALVAAVLREVGVRDLGPWPDALAPAMAKHGIDTRARVPRFLSNVLHETGGLRVFVENLNYSVTGLISTFGRHRISAADCHRLGRKPGEKGLSEERQAAIANLIYGGAWGRANLGNHQPNDGSYFRGRGLIQLTGRANWTRLAKTMGINVVQLHDALMTPEGSAESAAHFWSAAGCNEDADAGDSRGCRRLVNGGYNGMDDVERWEHRLEAAIREVAL
jgi:putative chitinase